MIRRRLLSGLDAWNADARLAFANGQAYFRWWDRVKTGIFFVGIGALLVAYKVNERSKR